MPRLFHPDNEGYPVFVTTTCYEKKKHFEKPENAEIAICTIDRLRKGEIWLVAEYIVMPDHVHLIDLPIQSLSYCMQEFKKSVAGIINRREKVIGCKFWLDEYYERTIRNDEEYSKIVEYIWWNPVKVGLAKAPHDCKFSSSNPLRQTDREKFY